MGMVDISSVRSISIDSARSIDSDTRRSRVSQKDTKAERNSTMQLGTGSHTYEWIDRWAKLPSGKEFGYTHGVVVDKADNVYVFNQSRDALCAFDPEGKFIRSWGEEYAKGAHGLYS